MREKRNKAKETKEDIFDFGETAYLPGGKAVVMMMDSGDLIENADAKGKVVNPTNVKLKEIPTWMPRGTSNSLPEDIITKCYNNVAVSSSIEFNTRIAYGDGIMVVRKKRDDQGQMVYEELLESEAPEIFTFIEDNNYVRLAQEWANDISVFADAYVQFVFNKQDPKRKIVRIVNLETVYSRLSQMNADGVIEWHGYSAKWKNDASTDLIATPFLDRKAPLYDLKMRIGKIPNETGKNVDKKENSFVMSIAPPTPGRFYYGMPSWWSVFLSGWYDFACAIPEFKKALIRNSMVIKYHVKIREGFWNKLYNSENITDPALKIARRRKFLEDMNAFLSGAGNSGKSFISEFVYDKVKGAEEQDVIIDAVPNGLTDGQYVEDSEEASNVIYSATGVHPSIIGASPGKSKSINGTEARELFIIKQAMTKPIRDALTMPLYIVKAINDWPADIHFMIPNIVLETLDKGTGAIKQIGNQKI